MRVVELDLHERKLTLHSSAGEVVERTLPAGTFMRDTNIEQFVLHADLGELRIDLPAGASATVELHRNDRAVNELRARS